MNYEVINGDNINKLKNYPDNYFDSVVTDPPYGLGKEPNAAELMKDWIEHGYHEIEGKGFMGKEWDAFVPQPIFWQEVFRVLKPGGHVLAFYGTRTYDWGVMAMRFAGFEVRDCIQWLYGSGFPKSHNISKALDKMEGAEREVIGEQVIPYKDKNRSVLQPKDGWNNNSMKTKFDITAPSTDAAKQWDGWGTALKPANEPIVLARKPLEKGLSIAENILKWGVGGINIDASRIKHNEEIKTMKPQQEYNKFFGQGGRHEETTELKGSGRFPANIILTHHEDCVCKGTKKVKGMIDKPTNRTKKGNTWNEQTSGGLRKDMPKNSGGFADEDGNETVENWDCHEDCPIRILDEQSGGASRFFYVAKACKSERNKGLDGFEEKRSSAYGYEICLGEKGEGMFKDRNPIKQNFHPTVKPIKLMQYLVKMITPPNGIVLDPFCGSGSTGVACKLDGFNFVGIEQDLEYTKIAEARIKNTQIEQKQLEIF